MIPGRGSAPAGKEAPIRQAEELLTEEKEQLESDLETIRKNRGCLRDSVVKARRDAQQSILSVGRKALPFLKEDLFGEDSPLETFAFSLYVDVLAEEEDFSLILETLASPNVSRTSDGSSATHLCRALGRITVEMRRKDPQDKRLRTVGARLIGILDGSPESVSARSGCLSVLAMTGTEEARKYIGENIQELGRRGLSFRQVEPMGYLDDVASVPAFRLQRYKFPTWESILESRKEAGQRALEIERSGVANDEPLGVVSSHKWELTAERARQLCERVNETSYSLERDPSRGIEPTVTPALRLHLFNYLRKNPEASEADLEKVAKKMSRLSRVEAQFAVEDNPLPTIGIEIECPKGYLSREKVAVLDALGIYNEFELSDLWEVNPEFSYSPWVQARIIQELAMMGAIPLQDADEGKQVPEWALLSLHVNLGAPEGVTEKMLSSFSDDIYLLNDMITYAFTSPQRLRKRKTRLSIDWSGSAEESRKTGKKVSEASERTSGLVRLELRASEFRDFPTYRMLVESQRMAGMFFSRVKRSVGLEMTDTEWMLADLWDEFKVDAAQNLEEYASYKLNLLDLDVVEAAKLSETTDIKERCRSIIFDYSRSVSSLI